MIRTFRVLLRPIIFFFFSVTGESDEKVERAPFSDKGAVDSHE